MRRGEARSAEDELPKAAKPSESEPRSVAAAEMRVAHEAAAPKKSKKNLKN